ncbi:MAG: plasmid stabilization protein ParE [Idiomarina sp.]|uniref:Toxin n=1 Tax=Idiomarina aquatica TaxID=1327752 RepID=A0A4R6P0W6_9GAMM|nr:plasmid stabilization protein ParE [Idiomarina sp.]TDP31304.1 toxin ParE1/3/4 [Idiomarina aquatica]
MRIKISPLAKNDIKAIARYTEQRWGRSKRQSYLKALDSRIMQLADFPESGVACDEILPNYRKLSFNQHLIFYRRLNVESLLIVRILHQSMDVKL